MSFTIAVGGVPSVNSTTVYIDLTIASDVPFGNVAVYVSMGNFLVSAETQLFYACQHKPERVHALLYHVDVNAQNEYGLTPLHIACRFQPSLVKTLVEHGANIHARTPRASTPLHFAARCQPSVVAYLVELGADVNVKTDEGWTPLHSSCQNKSSVVEYLVKHGANVNAMNKYDETPLDVACRFHPSVVDFLVKHGAYINKQNVNGFTPLHIATIWQPSVVECLVEHGADVRARTRANDTPLDLARRYHDKIVPFLQNLVYIKDSEDEEYVPVEVGACVVCYVNIKKVRFEPCGHVVTCSTCSLRVETCPVCNATISKKQRVFL